MNFQYKAFIHSRTPRSDCPTHGVHLVNVPWSRPGSEFTLLFEALVLALIAQMPVLAVARIVDEYDTRLWRILHHYVDEARTADDHSQVRNIAIDETTCQRGQRYISLSYDTDARRLLFATPNREAFTVGCVVKDLKEHGGKPEQIENVACDISKAYHRRTTGALEAINGLLQAARSKARGYRNVNNFITMAYLIAGKLPLSSVGS